MLTGYMGKIAWVDLTAETVEIQTLDEKVARKYVGGKGLGAYLLYKHLKPGINPLGPENMMIFVTGPLTGTHFPAVSRSGVVTKSPLTGAFLDSYSGGFFGTQLKWSGFDAVVVQGKVRQPSFLHIENNDIRIKNAAHLWGRTTSETEKTLQEEIGGNKKMKGSIAAIGPAGENLVKYACIINEKRAHGRGGAGAVMGSKNLKAVVVQGNQKPGYADKDAFDAVLKRCRSQIAEHHITKKGGPFPKFGTTHTIDLTNETGTLPSLNWKENTYEQIQNVNAGAFMKYLERPKACFSCPIGCSRISKASFNGREYSTEGPDYETMYAFGPHCGVSDPAAVIAADQLCDDYGIDTISCGVTIGFVMECYEKGLISKAQTEGLDFKFSNGSALVDAIHKIAENKGFGHLLAQGSKRISKKIKGTKAFAIHVKGLELPGYDPRGMKGQGLGYATSDRGGCHVRGNTLRTELMGLPEPIDPLEYEGKPAMVRNMQLMYAACDCVITCLFGAFAVTLQDHAQAISAMTGWNLTEDDLKKTAERAWNITRLFNVREGFSRRDDTLPGRLFTLGSTSGPSKGEVMKENEFEKMLTRYYEIVGWDPQTGVPKKEKLKELEIDLI